MDNTMNITKELLIINGWADKGSYANINRGWYAEFIYGRQSLNIWEEKPDDAYTPDVHVRVADKCWKFMQAFRLAGVNYKLDTPKAFSNAEKTIEAISSTRPGHEWVRQL